MSAALQIGFAFGFLDSFFGNGRMEWILLVQTRNVRLVTNIPIAEYLSAWQVLWDLEIAEVLRDYVASNHQREQICLFFSSWLGISKWTQVPGFNVTYAKSIVRHGFKTGLSPPPPVFLYWPFQGGTSVVVPYCYLFFCPYLYFGSAIMLMTYFVNFR